MSARRGTELARYIGERSPVSVLQAALVRDFVRAEIVPDAIGRLYDVGMGIAEFDTIVTDDDGARVVAVEAPAGVQVAALKELIAIGIPRQMGIVDGGDREIPGVFTLGEARLEVAREAVAAFSEEAPPDRGALGPVMEARVAAGEFEVVEIDEATTMAGFADTAERDAVTPPPPAPERLEDQILARRRRRRSLPSQ